MTTKSQSSPISCEAAEPFGKFSLIESIGEGGMAQVFRATTAWAEGVAKEVCLKRILSPMALDPRMRELFVNEARVAASLTHANIVPVYEFGVIEGYYFLSMEYVNGFTLRQILIKSAQTREWIDLALVLHLVAEALEGLDYAHRKTDASGEPLGIVHRDLTPGNLMISAAGEVKILDFGIAMMAGPTDENDRKGAATHISNVAGGKPGYMSPEQAASMAVDHRSDIYSVGILLFEMLTHRRLFRVRSVAERLAFPPSVLAPSSLAEDIPTSLDPLVVKALDARPGNRYQSAAEFRDALRDYMHAHGLRAGPSSLARALARRFDPAELTSGGDASYSGPEQLSRPPEIRHTQPRQRTISTNVARVSLEDALPPEPTTRHLSIKTVLLVVLPIVAAGLLAALFY